MAGFARVRRNDGEPTWVREASDELFVLAHAPWVSLEETGEVLSARGAVRAAPVTPSKIVCVGRNYLAHARELGHEVPAEPLLFFKPPSSIIGDGDAIELPPQSERVDHEGELGVVIGKRATCVSEATALSHVFGYTCVNDVTARDLQKKDGQWARAKGFDTFCPVGPRIVTKLDPQALRVRCRVGDVVRQEGETRDMIFPVARLIAYISAAMTLEPGDLIATGTPEGVAPLAAGDRVEVEIDGIGVLANVVRPRGA